MNGRKRWNELTPQQRRGIAVMGLIQFALLLAALIDLKRRPAEEIYGKKGLWIGLVFINVIGPISYFVWGRKRR